MEGVLEEVTSGLAECEFLTNFLSQFPPKASFEVLSQMLRERNSSLQEMKESLGDQKSQEQQFKHASDLLNCKRNALQLQKGAIEKQMEDNERKMEISKEMGNCLADTNGEYIDIREELADLADKPERTYPKQNHRQDLVTTGTLDPEIEALLNAAEAEEEASKRKSIESKSIGEPDALTPRKKVSFADEPEEIVEQPFSEDEDSDINYSAQISDDEDDDFSFEDEWEDPSHVMGIPKHIIEQYMESAPRNLDPQKLRPMKQENRNDPGLTIKEITERLYDIEGLSDEDSVDDEYEIKQREIDTAYVIHKRRYESRMKQEILEQDIDTNEYLYRQEEEHFDIVENELASTLRQVVHLDEDSIVPKSKPSEEQFEAPKRVSQFKASMQRIVR